MWIIILVAGNTLSIYSILPIDVTIGAVKVLVLTSQRKVRLIVIEYGRLPRSRNMATAAVSVKLPIVWIVILVTDSAGDV